MKERAKFNINSTKYEISIISTIYTKYTIDEKCTNANAKY